MQMKRNDTPLSASSNRGVCNLPGSDDLFIGAIERGLDESLKSHDLLYMSNLKDRAGLFIHGIHVVFSRLGVHEG